MRLSFIRLVLGPLGNNVYLLGDEDTKAAVIIDPSFESDKAVAEAVRQGWILKQIWLTHAHFDHTAGAKQVADSFSPQLPVGIHKDAEEWMNTYGIGNSFGFEVPPVPTQRFYFRQGEFLSLDPEINEPVVEVREAPGHSPGSVVFYCEPLEVLFCGDVIFRESIGRTDLQGGDFETLIHSIQSQVMSLPDTTTLLPGHGPESSVGYERINNPYLA